MDSGKQSPRFETSTLDISKLNEILKMLRLCKFPETKWFQFGLNLRLSHPTLKAIEATHGRDLGRCLMECLSKWLTKADDVVGPLTWQTLSEALYGISENTVAEELIQIVANPACKLFRLYYVRLSQVSLPEKSVQLLHTEGVISSKTLAEVKSHYGLLVGGPLRALRTTVAEDHNKLRVLATVLMRFDQTQSLGQEILDDYDKTFPSDHKVQDSPQLLPAADTDTSAAVATRSQTVTTLDLMKGMLGRLLYNLTPLIEKSIKSVEDLKLFLRQCRPELKPQLAVAKTFDDVMKIIEEKCSIVNITLLEDIIKNYEIEEAVELISAYKVSLHEFGNQRNSLGACDNVPLRQFSSSHLACETITFTLNWDTDDHTLNDVNEFQTNAFQALDRRVEVVVIRKANSITVTCYAPHYLMESLLLIARENLDELKEMGLMSLTVGYYTVYDQQARDEEVIRLQEENNLLKKQHADLSETENDESDSDSDSSTSTDIVFVVPEHEGDALAVTFHHYSIDEMEENRIQDEELLLDDQQGSTKGKKRSHSCDGDDPSVISIPRKPHYSDDKSTTVRDISRKRGHPSSSDDVSPSKMIAREHDTDIVSQSVMQEKESEIDELKEMKGIKQYESRSTSPIIYQPLSVLSEATNEVFIPNEICTLNTQFLKDIITNQTIKIKVRQALVLFTGLPLTGKSDAFHSFFRQHVQPSPFFSQHAKNGPQVQNDISYYDLMATVNPKSRLHPLKFNEAENESTCLFGLLSGFQQLSKGKKILFDLQDAKCFENYSLREHLRYMYQCFCDCLSNEENIKHGNVFSDEYVLVNVWDVPTNNIIHHILLQLQVHLTKSHLCQFLDLERDLNALQEPPEMEKSVDSANLMKWRPRFHYLLRSCRITGSTGENRTGVCTIFAEHKGRYNEQLKLKAEELKDVIQSSAKHIGVAELLNDRIECINIADSIEPISGKFKEVVTKTQFEEVPIAWIFLRSFFHCSDKKFVSKKVLKALAEECGIWMISLLQTSANSIHLLEVYLISVWLMVKTNMLS